MRRWPAFHRGLLGSLLLDDTRPKLVGVHLENESRRPVIREIVVKVDLAGRGRRHAIARSLGAWGKCSIEGGVECSAAFIVYVLDAVVAGAAGVGDEFGDVIFFERPIAVAGVDRRDIQPIALRRPERGPGALGSAMPPVIPALSTSSNSMPPLDG